MNLEQTIIDKLATFSPVHCELLNESHMHAGPATDSHYKLVLVSDAFEGKRQVARHQLVYGALQEELAGPVHALAIHTFTQQEWDKEGQVPASPQCQGSH